MTFFYRFHREIRCILLSTMEPSKMNELLARMTPEEINDGLWLVGVFVHRGPPLVTLLLSKR